MEMETGHSVKKGTGRGKRRVRGNGSWERKGSISPSLDKRRATCLSKGSGEGPAHPATQLVGKETLLTRVSARMLTWNMDGFTHAARRLEVENSLWNTKLILRH